MFSKSLLFIVGISSVLSAFGRPTVSARSDLQSRLYARDVLNNYLDIEARDLSNEVAELVRRSLYSRMAPITIKKPPPHPAATPDSHQGSTFGVTWGQDHLQTDKDKQKAMMEHLEHAKANDPKLKDMAHAQLVDHNGKAPGDIHGSADGQSHVTIHAWDKDGKQIMGHNGLNESDKHHVYAPPKKQ